MREGWQKIQLADVCQKTNNIKWTEFNGESFKYVDLSSVSRESLTITESSFVNRTNAPSRAKKIIKNDDVIFATTRPTLKRVTRINDEFDNQICSTGYCVLRPQIERIHSKFIYYFILTDEFMNRMESIQRGASYPAVSDKDVKSTFLNVPSLPEQKAIVKILDEAFAKIDQAKANIEKNIQNAKELFQSKLNEIFSQRGEGWEEKRFKEVCVLQRGFDLPKRLRIKGEYSLVTSSGIKDSHNEYKVEAPGVVTGRSGSIGKVFYVEENFWPLNTALYIKDFNSNIRKYIFYFLQSFDLSRFSSGAGVPTLNRNFVHDEVVLSTTDKVLQERLISVLDELDLQTNSAIEKYNAKSEKLAELKKSILQKAFSGELTKDFAYLAEMNSVAIAAEPVATYKKS